MTNLFNKCTLDMHLLVEKELAELTGYETAMTFSTGFQTNLGIISAVCGRHDYIITRVLKQGVPADYSF